MVELRGLDGKVSGVKEVRMILMVAIKGSSIYRNRLYN